MARKEIASAAETAANAAQRGSRAAEKRRARKEVAGGAASGASSAMGALRLPEHEAAQLVVAGGRGQLPHRAAVVEDEDAGRKRAQLVEVERGDQNRRAPVPRRPERVVHQAGGAQVEPARRLHGDDQARWAPAAQLARDDELLLIAAGGRGGGREGV